MNNLAGLKRGLAMDRSLVMDFPPVGKTFYVSSVNGTDTTLSGKTWDLPFATIAYAISQCVASRGDIIYISPFHAETVTASIAMSKIGVSLIGVKLGNKLPTITPNGTIDAISITGAGCSVGNIDFAGPSTDAQTADINIAAANCSVFGTRHIGSITGKNKVAIITVTSAGHDALIDGIRFSNDVVEVVGGIVIEGAAQRIEICNCLNHGSFGYTDGALHVSAVALSIHVHHNVFSNAKAAAACVNFSANATGIVHNNFIAGRHTTIANNFVTGTGIDAFENYVCEEAVKSGLLLPAVDAE